MKQINTLWPERLQSFYKEVQRYLKYLFNDHFRIVLIFGGGAAIYYYSQWVNTLSPKFPVALVLATLLALFLTFSPIITLLKEADIVFLLPLEEKLSTYFKKGIRFSFMIQAYLIIVVLAICMPMYNQVKGVGFQTFLFLLAVTLIMKYWNIMLHWNMLKMKGKGHVWAGKIIRYFMNATLLYFIINEASLYFTVSVLLIMLAFTYYVIGIAKDQPIKWETLIHQEEARMQIFYRAANLVTDVPQLKGRVKRRKWLDPLVSAIPFGKQQTYHFLYRRTLIRTSEYSGLIIRLTLIAAILIFFSKHLYVSLGLAVLFMYLTGFQLLPLLRHHQVKVWPSLYPLQNPLKKQSFLQLLLKLLLFQAILFGMMVLVQGKLIQSVAVIVVGILFAFLFANVYAPKRIAKMK